MGIIKQASDDFDADLVAFKASATPTRAQLRKYVAALVTRGQEWLAKRDAQDASAASDFAASKAAQFSNFTDALPDPTLSVAPATDPVVP
jgi:hypothetical protein